MGYSMTQESKKSNLALVVCLVVLLGVFFLFGWQWLGWWSNGSSEEGQLWLDGALYFNHLQMREDLRDFNLGVAYKRFSARYFALLLRYHDAGLNESVRELSGCLSEQSQLECQPFFQAVDGNLYRVLRDRYAGSKVFSQDPLSWNIVGGDVNAVKSTNAY